MHAGTIKPTAGSYGMWLHTLSLKDFTVTLRFAPHRWSCHYVRHGKCVFSVSMCYPVDHGLHSEVSSFCLYNSEAAQQGRELCWEPCWPVLKLWGWCQGAAWLWIANTLLLPHYYSVHIDGHWAGSDWAPSLHYLSVFICEVAASWLLVLWLDSRDLLA